MVIPFCNVYKTLMSVFFTDRYLLPHGNSFVSNFVRNTIVSFLVIASISNFSDAAPFKYDLRTDEHDLVTEHFIVTSSMRDPAG